MLPPFLGQPDSSDPTLPHDHLDLIRRVRADFASLTGEMKETFIREPGHPPLDEGSVGYLAALNHLKLSFSLYISSYRQRQQQLPEGATVHPPLYSLIDVTDALVSSLTHFSFMSR